MRIMVMTAHLGCGPDRTTHPIPTSVANTPQATWATTNSSARMEEDSPPVTIFLRVASR
jgi:hypothetical protein